MKHNLKILPEFFQAVCSGRNTFEIRKNDRNFNVGDTLILQEYWAEGQQYTGCVIERKITYISYYEQKENYFRSHRQAIA